MPGPLRIGFLGGVPPALGGGGLERQLDDTATALAARGHAVARVERAERGEAFDVVHAFGAEPNVWHALRHARTRPPLVVSPVLVVSPGRDELLLRLMARLPVLTAARMRAEVVRGADAIVALTAYEQRLLVRALGAAAARVEVVPNGSGSLDAPDAPMPDGVPDAPFALLLGAVSRRKRQADVVGALDGVLRVVVAGGFDGTPQERAEWEQVVARADATWLHHVGDPGAVAALERSAGVLVHWSAAETQSLAVVEALSLGTPVVLSDIPSHRELAAAHPQHVRIAARIEQIAPAAAELARAPRPPQPPAIPRWGDVAEGLERIYRRVAASAPRTARQ